MGKNCETCKLFNEISDKKGFCQFWETEVSKNDFCIEYKSPEPEPLEDNKKK